MTGVVQSSGKVLVYLVNKSLQQVEIGRIVESIHLGNIVNRCFHLINVNPGHMCRQGRRRQYCCDVLYMCLTENLRAIKLSGLHLLGVVTRGLVVN